MARRRNRRSRDPSARATAAARTSTKLTKVNVPMKANRMQKPMAKAARSAGLRQWSPIAAKRRLRRRHRMHRLDALDREIDQRRAGKVQQREEIEVRCQPERVGDGRRHQPPDQVAGDVAGDIGGERAAGVHRAALLAEIGQRQRERRGHAQPLRDAQDRERREIGRARQQRGRDREQDQAQENAEPAVDMRAEEADHEAGDRHAHACWR